MRPPARSLLPILVIAAAAVTAQAGPPNRTIDDQRLFVSLLDDGDKAIDRSKQRATAARKLESLERARALLQRAWSISVSRDSPAYDRMQGRVEPLLVRVLCDEAWIHVQRKSLPLAASLVRAALAIDPDDSRAINLKLRIEGSLDKDLFDENLGVSAIGRISDRRAATAGPVRERGVASRLAGRR